MPSGEVEVEVEEEVEEQRAVDMQDLEPLEGYEEAPVWEEGEE